MNLNQSKISQFSQLILTNVAGCGQQESSAATTALTQTAPLHADQTVLQQQRIQREVRVHKPTMIFFKYLNRE